MQKDIQNKNQWVVGKESESDGCGKVILKRFDYVFLFQDNKF